MFIVKIIPIVAIISVQNNNQVLGLSSFNNYQEDGGIFDILVNYDELVSKTSMSSRTTEDFSLDVVSLFYTNIILTNYIQFKHMTHKHTLYFYVWFIA